MNLTHLGGGKRTLSLGMGHIRGLGVSGGGGGWWGSLTLAGGGSTLRSGGLASRSWASSTVRREASLL